MSVTRMVGLVLALALVVGGAQIAGGAPTLALAGEYAWPHAPVVRTLEKIEPPSGFTRVALDGKGFGAWLRGLPLLPQGSPVFLWDGLPKPYQIGHFAVVDLDVGKQNLQQCADAIMRLRAEYLWATGRAGEVNALPGNSVKWQGSGWPAFRRYLNGVMAVTGSATMDARMHKAPKGHRLLPGDVLVQGGHPGHAMLVLDVADDGKGNRVVLIGQSYMPAQQFHVVNNLWELKISPWYREADLDIAFLNQGLQTPSWRPFHRKDVRTW